MGLSRIEREKRVVCIMIRLYCLKKEKNKQLCGDCVSLMEYACARLEHCPFGEEKTACKRCKIHCYQSQMREKMRKVMRFAGPRMLFYHPLMACRHLLEK